MNKMNEDEILKDIDNYITFANKSENFSDINEYLHCKELARRMKGLLDLYKKEKEKNKELTDFIEAIEELKQAKKLITDLVYEMNKFEDEFISKDKIKAKIEEYNKIRAATNDDDIYDAMVNYIDALNDLLEEN